jgi:hypothetical protein
VTSTARKCTASSKMEPTCSTGMDLKKGGAEPAEPVAQKSGPA